MIDIKTTPEAIARGEYGEHDMDNWFAIASARQLEQFILAKKTYTRGNRSLESVKAIESIERATIALNIRLGEDTANAVSKLIQHTEKLTFQTDKQIEYAQTLTQQTDKLVDYSKLLTTQTEIVVNESKGLGRLTWGLFWLTVVLAILTAGLLYIDWHKEHQGASVRTETGK